MQGCERACGHACARWSQMVVCGGSFRAKWACSKGALELDSCAQKLGLRISETQLFEAESRLAKARREFEHFRLQSLS